MSGPTTEGPIVSFNFALDQKVKNNFGEEGVVEMLGFDDGGAKCYVRTKQGGNWVKQRDLEAIA